MCTLPRPIAVIAFDEGQDNSIVPYNGAQTPNLATDCAPNMSCVGIGFPSAVVNFETWAKFDGCTGSATADPNNSICQQYTSCMGSTTVILCTDQSSQHLAAYSNATAKVAATAWNVFKTRIVAVGVPFQLSTQRGVEALVHLDGHRKDVESRPAEARLAVGCALVTSRCRAAPGR